MRPLTSRMRRALAGLGGLLLLALVIGFTLLLRTCSVRELESLPEPERRALYDRTLETLRTSCMHSRGPTLTKHCRDQATFIQRFPECQQECRELAERFEPKPSR